MEEKEKKVEEKPATHNKRAQYYALGTVGVIALALFLNFINDFSSKKEEPKKTETAQQSTNLKAQQLKSILSENERPRSPQQQVNTNTTQGDNDANTPPRQSPYTSRGDRGAREQKSDDQNSPEKIRARFEAEELNRALRARSERQHFQSKQQTRSIQGNPYAGRNTFASSTNAEKIEAAGQERNAISEKIRALESKGQNQYAESTDKLQRARKGVENSLNQANGVQPVRASSIPNGVVGYSQDNNYNASTEGMEKLPVGTVVNAITTMTAISDYQGGTMKAMLSNDMYDASNTYVLAPKGSEFIIKVVKASGVNEVIENRLAFTVQWLVLPNGDRIDFSKAAGLDRMGTPAVEGDEVDRHILAQILGVTAYAIVGSKSSYAGTGDGEDSLAGDIGAGLRGQSKNIAGKYLQIVPTVKLHAGAPIRIITEDEMYIYPWKNIYEENYYN
ncbi:TrbI/VirB10 family protein [Providencia rettgeri]|uniref:TrbI/VirB10 family protein n=1 Tax=Providencia rettgeri TaxID=587 RepID=UPI001419CEBA|nr:TrbI/VirB10 family protein [Providencia rettgeri]NIH07059.1 TrbI/VirB10 family protein [Providencia rettgeri]